MKLLLIIAAISISGPSSAADPIVGRASVIDGDTIQIAGQRIRFDGVDAPESWQVCIDRAGAEYRCGKAAAEALDAFLAASGPTRCIETDRDRYDRAVADCARADGKSVNAWLVERGFALDWPRHSKGRYSSQQAAARAARHGMWQGDFLEPWEARKQRRQ